MRASTILVGCTSCGGHGLNTSWSGHGADRHATCVHFFTRHLFRDTVLIFGPTYLRSYLSSVLLILGAMLPTSPLPPPPFIGVSITTATQRRAQAPAHTAGASGGLKRRAQAAGTAGL